MRPSSLDTTNSRALIITQINDITSDIVFCWILKNSKSMNVRRLNTEETTNMTITFKGQFLKIMFNGVTISKIWHRRGRLNFLQRDIPVVQTIYNYLKNEADIVVKSSEIYLKENTDYVGSFLKETENYKPHQLQIALKCGLKVPDTLITNSKNDLIAFARKQNKVICKDLRYPVNIKLKEERLVSKGTLLVTEKMLENLNEDFAPMLFQECIDKEYEIRVFFFKDDYYPMAIFSQNNEKTKIDFRNYDKEKPNRCVPVILPDVILAKLKKFSKEYDLNTGSIDLIKSKKGEYVFLEVNPQGQLDWLSKNCNYYIERRISNFFTNG